MVLRMMSLQKAAYLASYVHREVVLQPEATIVPALVVLQVARVLQDLCYMFLCHFSGGAADKFEPAHLSIWMQTDRHTDRQTDRQTDRRTDRQTDRRLDGLTDGRNLSKMWIAAQSVAEDYHSLPELL